MVGKLKKIFSNKKILGLILIVLSVFIIKGSDITTKLDTNKSNKTNLKESSSSVQLSFVNLDSISLKYKDITEKTDISEITGKINMKNVDQSQIKTYSLTFNKFSNSNGMVSNTDSWSVDYNGNEDEFQVDLSNDTRIAYYYNEEIFEGYYSVNVEITLNNNQKIESNAFYLIPTEHDEIHSEMGWNIKEPLKITNIKSNIVYGDDNLLKRYYHITGTSQSTDGNVELLTFKNGNSYKNVESTLTSSWSADLGRDSLNEYFIDTSNEGLYTVVARATIDGKEYYSAYETLEDLEPESITISGVDDNYTLNVGDTQQLNPKLGTNSEAPFNYTVTTGSDVITVSGKGLVTANKSGTATVQISSGEYGYNNEPAYTKNITVTVNDKAENEKKVELTEDNIRQTVNNISHSDFKLFIKDYDNVEKIDTSKISFYDSQNNKLDNVTYIDVDKDNSCSTSPMFPSGCNASLKLAYTNETKKDITITKIEFNEGFVVYKDKTTNKKEADASLHITISGTPLITGVEDQKSYYQAVTPKANYTSEPEIIVSLKKNDGEGNYVEVEDYKLGQTISEPGSYSLELYNSIIKKTYSYDFNIENRDLKILNNEIKKDIYELYNEDSVNINLFIPDKENIKTIDMAKIKLIPDNHNADIGVLKKEINESSNSDGSNYTLKLSGFYNKENNDQKLAGLVIEKGAITYSDNSTNEELEYNNISINIKKVLVNQNDGKVLEDGKTYKSAITPISLVDNLDFRGSYNIVLKKNNIEIEDYELGQSITENGNYELKFNCVDYDTNNEITYNFTIDIDEIELLTPTSSLNEFVDDLELHLKIKDINNFRSMDISKVKFYEFDGTELSFKADVMGKTCDNCNGYNYVITYKNIINPDNNKYPTVSKIKFESGAIIYYDKNNKQYSESKELENNVNITINPFDQSQSNSFSGSYTPQMNNVNDDDYVFLLYKDNKRIKDYEYGNEISDPGTYILKVLYNNAIYTKTFTINDPVFIELNSDIKDLELNSNVITLYKTNTVTEFKSNFKTLNAKIYESDAKLENNNVTGTEISDENYVTTGSKVILNRKNKTENDIYTIVVMGDVDKNGEVTVNDITNLRYYFNQIANNETITYDKYQIAAMDVDKNNDIGVNDITRMRSYIVKIINSFKVVNENE